MHVPRAPATVGPKSRHPTCSYPANPSPSPSPNGARNAIRVTVHDETQPRTIDVHAPQPTGRQAIAVFGHLPPGAHTIAVTGRSPAGS